MARGWCINAALRKGGREGGRERERERGRERERSRNDETKRKIHPNVRRLCVKYLPLL